MAYHETATYYHISYFRLWLDCNCNIHRRKQWKNEGTRTRETTTTRSPEKINESDNKKKPGTLTMGTTSSPTESTMKHNTITWSLVQAKPSSYLTVSPQSSYLFWSEEREHKHKHRREIILLNPSKAHKHMRAYVCMYILQCVMEGISVLLLNITQSHSLPPFLSKELKFKGKVELELNPMIWVLAVGNGKKSDSLFRERETLSLLLLCVGNNKGIRDKSVSGRKK
jgi:hypothetical protein